MSVAKRETHPANTRPAPGVPSVPLPEATKQSALAILDAELPQLEAKIQRIGLADSPARARELVQEVKKFLFVSWLGAKVGVPMFSCLIDEVWHQFVLFTRDYASFCERFFGSFRHHVPDEADQAGAENGETWMMSFEAFRRVYEDLYGPLSPAWLDHLSLTHTTRLNWHAPDAPRAVRVETGRAVLFRMSDEPEVLCYASLRARESLELMAREQMFLVRELPGLKPNERLELCRPLVEHGLLKLTP